MNICVYSDHFYNLSIDGDRAALGKLGQKLSELSRMPDGYLVFATTPTDAGDISSVELCMTKRVPVVCTRVYRGKPEPFQSKLIFPAKVSLGGFKCDVSSSACHKVSYALMPAAGDSDETKYQVPDIICTYCGREVSPLSYQVYQFLYADGECCSESQTVEFDVDDFIRISRRRMRRNIELDGLCTIRAWRKGPSTVVIELTEKGITEIREQYMVPLLSNPENSFFHRHFYHLARVGKLDYTELLLRVANIEQYKQTRRIKQASYDKYIHISWATCMNLRCAYRFLAAENSWDVDKPTYEDYQNIPIGNSSCPRCRSPYYISHSACYQKLK